MKSDIENFKLLFQTTDDGRIREKCTFVVPIAMKKERTNSKTVGFFRLALGKKKTGNMLLPDLSYTFFFLFKKKILIPNTSDRISPIKLYS